MLLLLWLQLVVSSAAKSTSTSRSGQRWARMALLLTRRAQPRERSCDRTNNANEAAGTVLQ